MAFLKKSAPAAEPAPAPAPEPFVVPSLAEADEGYGALCAREVEVQGKLAELVREAKQLERELAVTPAPVVRPAVAKLIGDTVIDERTALATRLRAVRGDITDHEQAVEWIKRRRAEAHGKASAAVCRAVQPEYKRRATAIATALEAVRVARDSYESLRDELEAQNVAWLSLGPLGLAFLGDRHDGQLHRFLAEAKAAGYVD